MYIEIIEGEFYQKQPGKWGRIRSRQEAVKRGDEAPSTARVSFRVSTKRRETSVRKDRELWGLEQLLALATLLSHCEWCDLTSLRTQTSKWVIDLKNRSNEKLPKISAEPLLQGEKKNNNFKPSLFLHISFSWKTTPPIIQVKKEALRHTHSQPTDNLILPNPWGTVSQETLPRWEKTIHDYVGACKPQLSLLRVSIKVSHRGNAAY